jgi:hypothetical protein
MYLPLFGQVNLPWFITLHAFWLTFTGLHLLFTAPLSTFISSRSKSSTSPKSSLSKKDDHSALLGMSSLGLGLAYLTTSYMAIEENQFLYATVIGRIVLGSLVGLRRALEVVGGKERQGEVKRLDGEKGIQMAVYVGLYDLLGGIVLGFWLGKGGFSGRPPVH